MIEPKSTFGPETVGMALSASTARSSCHEAVPMEAMEDVAVTSYSSQTGP